jgi:hypothetical protein
MHAAFKPIEAAHRDLFNDFFSRDAPRASEFTFTNLFMWRHKYFPSWLTAEDCLLILLQPPGEAPYALPPIGKGDKTRALNLLVDALRPISDEPIIRRADREFVDRCVDPEKFHALEDPDNHDYVYLAENLTELPGKKFHKKKNHVNKFVKNHSFEYRTLDPSLTARVLDLQEEWCQLRECAINPGLFMENIAIHEALAHYEELGTTGGVILVDDKVEAFALGDLLNPETAVIHIEKANPKIPGLYAAINQFFCREEWSHVKYVNREQDLGLEGLRKAKLSYHPDHMVEKFNIVPK